EAVAAILAGEGDAEPLGPVALPWGRPGEGVDEARVGGLVGRGPEGPGGVVGAGNRRARGLRASPPPRRRGPPGGGRVRARPARATLAPAGSAERAAARREAPLPITSTSKLSLMRGITGPYQWIERSSSSTSPCDAGRGMFWLPWRPAAAAATAGRSCSGTPKARRRPKPPSAASPSTVAAPSARPERATAAGAWADAQRRPGQRQSARIAPL